MRPNTHREKIVQLLIMKLSIFEHNAEVDAIKKTFDYLGEQYDIEVTSERELKLSVNYEDEVHELTGFDPIFTYCSRLAHTLPSNPVHAAMVVQDIRAAENLKLEEIEEKLVSSMENSEHEKWWMNPYFKESTAADFYLTSRLKRERASGISLDDFPCVSIYADFDPTLPTSEESDEEETNDDVPSSRVQMYCVVS